MIHHLPVVGFPVAVIVILLAIVAGSIALINWEAAAPVIVGTVIMVVGSYWALTLLPPAVRRIGWTAVRRVWRHVLESQSRRRRGS